VTQLGTRSPCVPSSTSPLRSDGHEGSCDRCRTLPSIPRPQPRTATYNSRNVGRPVRLRSRTPRFRSSFVEAEQAFGVLGWASAPVALKELLPLARRSARRRTLEVTDGFPGCSPRSGASSYNSAPQGRV
jgi:hypothetical protein